MTFYSDFSVSFVTGQTEAVKFAHGMLLLRKSKGKNSP